MQLAKQESHTQNLLINYIYTCAKGTKVNDVVVLLCHYTAEEGGSVREGLAHFLLGCIAMFYSDYTLQCPFLHFYCKVTATGGQPTCKVRSTACS